MKSGGLGIKKTKKTLAVAAICWPPVLIGPAVLMGNLFRHFPEGSYHVMMGRLDHVWPPIDKNSMLPATHTFTRFPLCNSMGNGWRRMRAFARDLFALLEVTWKGLRIIRREKIDSIFVVADHYVELAALLMHWLTGKKIVLWLPDLYCVPELTRPNWAQSINRLIEPFLLRAMDLVLVTAKPTQEYYKEKYNLNTDILAHSVDLTRYDLQHSHPSANVTRILFTGTVEPCNQGSILDMIKVITELPEFDMELAIVSPNVSKQLEEIGMKNHRVTCMRAKREEIPALQQSADILFLPLCFEEHGYRYPSIVQTASPSKLPEYLAAGRPILVYAPAQSYYARYARQEGFALVVDQPDLEQLRQAIIELQGDKALRQQLVVNARRVAMEHHDSAKVSAQLQYLLGIAE